MKSTLRTIEVDERTAEVLQARAMARGMSVPEFLADIAANAEVLPADLALLRTKGEGPWSRGALSEDALRLAEFERVREGVPWNEVEAWMRSWGTPAELPPPVPRKL
jgi:hypothetical protein